MYIDLQYYWRVLLHVWSLKQWPGRTRTLIRLLLLVPLEYLFHTVFFLLDYLFFPALWRQKVQRPVFIVGHARSGTTLAHRLLAADGDVPDLVAHDLLSSDAVRESPGWRGPLPVG